MSTRLRGVIHGKIIELAHETDMPDGQQVVLTVDALVPRSLPGESIQQSAGSWADAAEALDQFLEWNRQQRKSN